MATVVNVDGTISGVEQARISVFDRGFLYGDSVYETLRAYGERLFRLERHLERLERSASLVGIDLVGGSRVIAEQALRTLAAAANADSAVRLIVTRGEGPIGIDPRLPSRPTQVVIVRPYDPLPAAVYQAGVPVIVARTFRNSPRALDPQIKSGNFLNNILAAREAVAGSAFEAILLNQEGLVAEGTQSNLFLVRGGVLCTPHPRAGLLRGVTRELVLEVARANGIACAESDIFVSELYEAEEAFLTSTLKGVVPIAAVGSRPVGGGPPGPLTRRITALVKDEVDRFLAGASG